MGKKKEAAASSPRPRGRKAAPPYEVAAGDFKARCLALLDRVRERRESYVVTKRGQPVAMVVPIEPMKEGEHDLFGCMRGTVRSYGDLISPIDARWEADD